MADVDAALDKVLGEAPTTWTPVDLAHVLAGDDSEEEPSLLARTDGVRLLYRGRLHSLYAEPEGLKTWLALEACRQELDAGQSVLYVDFEDNARAIVQRLRAMRVEDSTIKDGFTYIRPFERLTEKAWGELAASLATGPSLAVIDGVTEGMVLEGLNLLDNSDVATFLEKLPRRLGRAGPAVLQLDHVGRNKETRGRFAIGAQAKLAGIDGAAFSIDIKEPFGRNRTGRGRLLLRKDRQGFVSEHSLGDSRNIADLTATSDDGAVSIRVDPPADPAEWKPTHLMQKVSEVVELMPGINMRGIYDHVPGRKEYVRAAVTALLTENYIRTEPGTRGAVEHHPLRPYHEDETQ